MTEYILVQIIVFSSTLFISVVALHLSSLFFGVANAAWRKALVVMLVTGIIALTVQYLFALVNAETVKIAVIGVAQIILVRNYYKSTFKIAIGVVVVATIFTFIPLWLFYTKFGASMLSIG